MNVLIILNYQREVPPFMQMEISFAKELFGKIYYITPLLKNDNTNTIAYNNVSIKQIGKTIRLISFFAAILKMFSQVSIAQAFEVLKNRKFSLNYLKYIGKQIFAAENLIFKAKKIVNNHIVEDKVCVMATWFSVEALAAALLQKKYSTIYSCSLAHSFEIDQLKNSFAMFSFNTIKHAYLKKITFISNLMFISYLKQVTIPHKQIDYSKKIDVQYLGSKKIYEGQNPLNYNEFNICTCSGIIPVKRILLLLYALKHWEYGNITWTHIGSGPQEQEVRIAANELMTANQQVKICFLGQLTNNEVQEYFVKYTVDIFVNVSLSEGIPVSIMEAMSYGIPVMATDVGGTSEIVNESNGILLPKDVDAYTICQKIYFFFSLATRQKEHMRRNAFDYWEKNFNASKNMPRYFEKILRELNEY